MRKILVLLVLVMVPFVCFAAEQPVWVEVTGEALMGDFDTAREVKDRSRRDAESRAIEKAVGVFIRSHTLVSNGQVADDLIYAAVRGKVVEEKVILADWDTAERTLYKTTIRALVEPVYPEKGEGLSATLFLSKSELKEGDAVQIFYQVSQDAHVYIFSIAADGSVTLLLPNATLSDNFTRVGKASSFPPPGSTIELKAMFLPDHKGDIAEERIKLVATLQKEELLSLGFKEGSFQVYDQHSTGMISDLIRRLNRIEPTQWAEASAFYRLKR
ncbi:MAG TPA: DUF4384 domain-containing protein [Desulfobacteraceae bacterium]|nr:DUF4384 domain-containing protein [Desulfobacteraceae bacterium]